MLTPTKRIVIGLLLACAVHGGSLTSRAEETADFFERKIRPVLVEHCFECHAAGSEVIQGGLRLDDPDLMRRGGDTGIAVLPGQPEKSLLLTAMRYEDVEMPPAGPLDPQVIADFETWIQQGAQDPRDRVASLSSTKKRIDWDAARSQWAFLTPQRHQPPQVIDQHWASNNIDRFIQARLEQNGLTPNPASDRATYIFRLSFDLIGLPPSVEEVEEFLNDPHPQARRRLVDRLLSSPQHAERWTRMWLDVARYAEDQAHKVGNNGSLTYPNAYRYRDWVIEALTQDMPYDEFIRLQLAADLVSPDDSAAHVALGFLGLGPKYYRRNSPEVMADEWEDRVDTVSRGLLGLTVACARCHDHKYDPIPTGDYYALAGVFASTEMFNRPLLDVELGKDGQAKKPESSLHIVRDGKATNLNVMIRGDVNKPGEPAPRRFLTVLSPTPRPLETNSGRGDLADAIVDQSNPLTARVIVNRVWREFFATGLVDTPSNFGALGSEPSHPQLLDDLAVRFMENRVVTEVAAARNRTVVNLRAE